ncbi:MAG: PIG-L family deacetylase [Candidatus Brockarchaeota archaeon]|nr:PIG-L family deacetylase [Candidatus Brockarchaeota archaeon]
MRERKCVAAFGAHIGDLELSFGGVAAKCAADGNRVVFVHMTAGERGHPSLPPEKYKEQKVREGAESARKLGVEFRLMPYSDGELECGREEALAVCRAIRELKPDAVVTHWKGSYHRDHAKVHEIVKEAVFFASLPGFGDLPRHSVRALYFCENWEDPKGFEPKVYADFSDSFDAWVEAIMVHEFVRGRGLPSDYPYADYYKALARLRGIEAGFEYAEAFMLDEDWGKGRLRLDRFPWPQP